VTLLRRVIAFNGKDYVDGSQIEVDYDNENFVYDFTLKGYPSTNLYVGWEVFSGNQDVSVGVIKGYPQGAQGDKLKLDAGKFYDYQIIAKHGPYKVTVKFIRKKKDFDIKNLMAIDKRLVNGKEVIRTANLNEILYLVRTNANSTRQINYRIETDAQVNDFWLGEPNWSTTAYNENITNDKNNSITKKIQLANRFNAFHYLDQWPSQSVSTIKAFGREASVTIQMVNEDRSKEKASLPPQIDNAINKVISSFNDLTKFLNKVSDGTIEKASIKDDFSLEYVNSEDQKTRHYFKNRNLSIGLTGTISTGEIPIPALTISVPNIVKIGAYIKPSISLRLSGGTTERKRSESETWEYYSFNLGGNIAGGVEGGVSARLFTKGDDDPTKMTAPNWIKVDAKGYAKASVFGGVEYRRLEDTPPNLVRFSAGIDPLILGVSATVKISTTILDTTLLDYSKEWYLTDRIIIENEIRF
jgi:hypothetical protein